MMMMNTLEIGNTHSYTHNAFPITLQWWQHYSRLTPWPCKLTQAAQMTHVMLLTEVLVCPQVSSLSCMCSAARRSAVLHFISTAKRSCSTSPTLWKRRSHEYRHCKYCTHIHDGEKVNTVCEKRLFFLDSLIYQYCIHSSEASLSVNQHCDTQTAIYTRKTSTARQIFIAEQYIKMT